MIFTLFIAGIIAGMIQFFIEKGLPIDVGSGEINLTSSDTGTESWLITFLKKHWHFFAHCIVGVAGAFLVPMINEIVSGNLAGLPKRPINDKSFTDTWSYLILLGYGIVFGYSSVRLLRNIATSILGRITKTQNQLNQTIIQQGEAINSVRGEIAQMKYTHQHLVSGYTASADMTKHGRAITQGSYYDAEKDAEDRKDYYKNIGQNNGTELLSALSKLLSETHVNQLGYGSSKQYLYREVDPHEDGLLRSIYSGESFTVEAMLAMDAQVEWLRAERVKSLSASTAEALSEVEMAELERALPYNCEHVVCQSWFGKKNPMVGDLHHLFTCEMGCNSFRNNLPYYDFPDYGFNFTNVIRDKCGKAANDPASNRVFEPEINKGVVARAVLYFIVRYPNEQINGRIYNRADVEMLINWHKQHAITLYERHRNRAIHYIQGNRNPFIDHPEWANKISFEFPVDMKESFSVNVGDEDINECCDDSVAFSERINLATDSACVENPRPWSDWRAGNSITALRNKVNILAPARSKASDGIVGDSAHWNRDSDHNPWLKDDTITYKRGVVTAIDITHDPVGGCDCNKLATSLQKNKDSRIKYVVWNKKIMSSYPHGGNLAWTWRDYSGTNPHTKHIHVSVDCDKVKYDDSRDWDVTV